MKTDSMKRDTLFDSMVMNAVMKRLRDGTGRAVTTDGKCSYLNKDGLKCAIGVFLPNGHPGRYVQGDVFSLLNKHRDLNSLWWAKNINLLRALQKVHDHKDHWSGTRFNLAGETTAALVKHTFGMRATFPTRAKCTIYELISSKVPGTPCWNVLASRDMFNCTQNKFEVGNIRSSNNVKTIVFKTDERELSTHLIEQLMFSALAKSRVPGHRGLRSSFSIGKPECVQKSDESRRYAVHFILSPPGQELIHYDDKTRSWSNTSDREEDLKIILRYLVNAAPANVASVTYD